MNRHVAVAATAAAGLALAASAVLTAPAATAAPTLAAVTASVTAQAAAGPSTPVRFAKRATATRYTGAAFDTCTAPAVEAMSAWTASPYRAIGVYVGGINRSCAQPNLTADWVGAVTGMGWRLLPIYLGRQAPCGDHPHATKITPSRAAAQGSADADDAINALGALGLQPGSAIYADMESYTPTIKSCRTAVLKYLSGYTTRLHRRGYLSGVYVNLASGAAHLGASYSAAAYARPDVLWVARWDGRQTTTGFTGVPKSAFSRHQRVKQYQGDHNETWNGVTMNIDSDWVDAPVATAAFSHLVTANTHYRSGPKKSSKSAGDLWAGTPVAVMCQTTGTRVNGTRVWDKLATGTYVSDAYLDTPAKPGWSSPIARCAYPYQVKPTGGTAARSGAGAAEAKKSILPGGALAWVVCQKKAAHKTGTTKVWDQLDNGRYVSDYFVASPSRKTYSSPVPRC